MLERDSDGHMNIARRGLLTRLHRSKQWVALSFVLALAVLASVPGMASVELRHVHALGYSADGKRLLVPDHFGIAVYEAGRWSKVPGALHDYMGFSVTRDYIFTSGHMAGSRGLSNPLGLLRSRDGGRTWTQLGFDADVEFHLVAAGYFSNALYVHNAAPNAYMPRAGIYRLAEERRGEWHRAQAHGLPGGLGMLAVHPRKPGMIAAATTAGLFLSLDAGDMFKPVVKGERVTAMLFMLEGDALLVGTYDAKPALFRLSIKTGSREDLTLPPFGRDAVAGMAQNPVRQTEIAVMTFERAVFVSADAGRTWKRIARPRGTPPAS
jgi:hypothetical protein